MLFHNEWLFIKPCFVLGGRQAFVPHLHGVPAVCVGGGGAPPQVHQVLQRGVRRQGDVHLSTPAGRD